MEYMRLKGMKYMRKNLGAIGEIIKQKHRFQRNYI